MVGGFQSTTFDSQGHSNVVLMGSEDNDFLNDVSFTSKNNILIGRGGDDYLSGNSQQDGTIAGYTYKPAAYEISPNGSLIKHLMYDAAVYEGNDNLFGITRFNFGGEHFDSIVFGQPDADNQIILNSSGTSNTNASFDNITVIGSEFNDNLIDPSLGSHHVLIGGRGNDSFTGNQNTIVAYAHTIANFNIESVGNTNITYVGDTRYYDEGKDIVASDIRNFDFGGFMYKGISEIFAPPEDHMLLVSSNFMTNVSFDSNGRSFLGVMGSQGNDTLISINGTNNQLAGKGGNDTIQGNETAIAMYAYNIYDYRMSNDMNFTITDISRHNYNEGSDTLFSISNFNFNGSAYTFNDNLGNGSIVFLSNFANNNNYDDIVVFGTQFLNSLTGGINKDTLIGNSQVDFISGNDGNDIIVGAGGDDTLSGGQGKDIFVVTPGDGNDIIIDFNAFEDKIDLHHFSTLLVQYDTGLMDGKIDAIEFNQFALDHITNNMGTQVISINNSESQENDTILSLLGSFFPLTVDNFIFNGPQPIIFGNVNATFDEPDNDFGSYMIMGDLDTYYTKSPSLPFISQTNTITDYGTFSINGAGEWTFEIFSNMLDSLNTGESALVSIDVSTNPDYGETVGLSSQIHISINGYDESIPPVVLDLNHDSQINLVSAQNSGVTLDNIYHNDSGASVGWVSPSDGILMYNPDGTGVFTQGNQIQFTGYHPDAKTDLQGLVAFDSDSNGLLDMHDQAYSQFGVWQDANTNAITEAGEYHSLSQLGIVSIALQSDGQTYTTEGNLIHGLSSYQTVDGKSWLVGDVSLAIVESEVLDKTTEIDFSQLPEEPTVLLPSSSTTQVAQASPEPIAASNDVEHVALMLEVVTEPQQCA